MRLKFLKFLLLFIALISLFLGLIAFSYPTFHHVSDFRVLSLNDDGSFETTSKVVLKNESWFSYSGRNIALKLFYKDSLVSTGQVTKEIDFLRNDLIEIPIQSQFYPLTFGKDFEKILLQDSLEFKAEIQGDFTFLGIHSTKEMTINLPVSELVSSIVSSSLSGQSLQLDSMRINSLGIGESEVSCQMKFVNSLNMAYEIVNVDFEIFADANDQLRIASGDFDLDQLLEPNDTISSEVEFRINHLKSIGSVLGKVKKREFRYFLNGIAHVIINDSRVQVPIRKAFVINPLTRTITVQE